MTAALQLGDLRGLGLDQLRGRITLVAELTVSGEIGFGIGELGLISIAIGRQLLDLGLIGTRDRSAASRSPALTVCPSLKAILTICPWIWLRTTSVL